MNTDNVGHPEVMPAEFPQSAIAYTRLLQLIFGDDCWKENEMRHINLPGNAAVVYRNGVGPAPSFRVAWIQDDQEKWFAKGSWCPAPEVKWMAVFDYTSNVQDMNPVRLWDEGKRGAVSRTVDVVYDDVAERLVAALRATGREQDVQDFMSY